MSDILNAILCVVRRESDLSLHGPGDMHQRLKEIDALVAAALNRTDDQPDPQHTERSRPVHPVLMAILEQQRAKGLRKYKTELHSHNGRDALVDALQEAVDGQQYMAQVIMELRSDLRLCLHRIRGLEHELGQAQQELECIHDNTEFERVKAEIEAEESGKVLPMHKVLASGDSSGA